MAVGRILAQVRVMLSARRLRSSVATGRGRRSGRVFVSEPLERRTLLTVNFVDIRPAGSVNLESFNNLVDFQGSVYFRATDGSTGLELWKSNGTTTTQVRDINPGSGSGSPGALTVFDGRLWFSANDGTAGSELWVSDGTEAGTLLLKDINPGATGSGPANLTVVGSTLFFTANDGTNGTELWKTDGTAVGTVLVSNIRSGSLSSSPTQLVDVSGTLFFAANDGSTGSELWKSNGTSAGTTLVRDILTGTTGSNINNMTNLNGTLLFSARDFQTGYPTYQYDEELWKSDGTTGGTIVVLEINAGNNGAFPSDFERIGNTVYFRASNGSTNGSELWKTDGTAAGTSMVKDIRSGSSSSAPSHLTNVSGTLMFRANDGTNGTELWKSDGTSAGTVLVKNIRAGSANSFPQFLTNVNGTLFFTADNGSTGYDGLWKSDGTSAGTTLVGDILPGSSAYPGLLTNVAGTLFFVSDSGSYGNKELLKSDGTTITALPGGGNGGSGPRNFESFSGGVLFTADNGTSGEELYRSNGTVAGTALVKDIRSGSNSSGPNYLTDVSGVVFFRANDGTNGYELWKSDGTTAGTVMVKDIRPGSSGSFPRHLTNVGGTLYFSASDGTNGFELWKSDGTSAGTVLVTNLNAGSSNAHPQNLTNVSGTLYFTANNGSTGYDGLFRSDGTAAGTVLLKNPGSGYAASLTNVSGTLFFAVHDGSYDRELWRSDGTSGGTVRVKDINPSGSSEPSQLVNAGGVLMFRANDGTNGMELWGSDGSSAGTVMVYDINGTTTSSGLNNLTELFGSVFFTANDGTTGTELWKSDGSAGGTTRVADLNPGNSSSVPVQLTNVSGLLYFAANDGSAGSELWRTDGVTVSLVDDIYPGSGSSGPSQFGSSGGTLFFQANNGSIGVELGIETSNILSDFGDAPASFPTLLAANGARHAAVGPTLGLNRDTESDGQPQVSAAGDDSSGTPDDEDGIAFNGSIVAGKTATVDVTIGNVSGRLDAWVDFNQDGDWNDSGEQVLADEALSVGLHSLQFGVPAGATAGTTVARFRVSQQGGLGHSGAATEGEVEDHVVTIDQGPPVITAPPATTQSLRPTIQWTAVPGAVEYEVWIGNQSTGVNPFLQATVAGTSWTPGVDLGIGKFNLWVRAKFSGSFGPWTTQYNFIVKARPTVQDPGRYQDTARPTLTWAALPGAVKYDLWIDDRLGGVSQFVRDQNITATNWTPSSDMPLALYNAWLRGIAADGTPGDWSVVTIFYVMPSPTVTSGLNPTFDRTPQFGWDAITGAVEYEIFVRDRNTGTTSLYQQNIAATTFTPAGSFSDGPYRFWVIGVSAANVRSFWSLYHDIYVGGRTDVLTPTGTTGDTTPTFTWRPVDEADHYDLWVDQVGGTTQIIREQNLATTSHTPTVPLPAGNYRAWVRAVSLTSEVSVWSLTSEFTIAASGQPDDPGAFSDLPVLVAALTATSTDQDETAVPPGDMAADSPAKADTSDAIVHVSAELPLLRGNPPPRRPEIADEVRRPAAQELPDAAFVWWPHRPIEEL